MVDEMIVFSILDLREMYWGCQAVEMDLSQVFYTYSDIVGLKETSNGWMFMLLISRTWYNIRK